MKKQLLFAAMLACTGAFAQVNPTDVGAPADIAILQNDFPGVRNGFTGLKIRYAVDELTFATWYDFNIGVTNGVITSTGLTNIDPGKPLTSEYRSTGSKTGNVYTALIELKDNGSWIPDERQIAYYDAAGRDSVWEMEYYDSDNSQYLPDTRISKNYNTSGQFTGYVVEEHDGSDWQYAGMRSIRYSGSQRISDTVYAEVQGMTIPAIVSSYFYNGSKLDSMVTFMNGSGGFVLRNAYKILSGADGGIDQIRIFAYESLKDSLYLDGRADLTGGTPVTGVREISKEEISVYPVPVTSVLNIDVKEGGSYQAEIFDLQGRKLISQAVSAHSSIDVSALNNGIYILTVQNQAGERMQKRIVIGK